MRIEIWSINHEDRNISLCLCSIVPLQNAGLCNRPVPSRQHTPLPYVRLWVGTKELYTHIASFDISFLFHSRLKLVACMCDRNKEKAFVA